MDKYYGIGKLRMEKQEDFLLTAKKSFYVNRPYGMRVDFEQNGFVLFNKALNMLGDDSPGKLEELPLEHFSDLEELPIQGATIQEHEKIINMFFYTHHTDPYQQEGFSFEYMKMYNQFIYPLSLILNRSL